MITINKSIFNAKEVAPFTKGTHGLTLKGAEDIIISECIFDNNGYSSISNEATGNVSIEDCEFKGTGVHNVIEGGQTFENGNVVVKRCKFVGAPKNNFVNFYKVADGSEHVVADCEFAPTVDNNTLRLSNYNNANAKFTLINCNSVYAEGEPTDYTNLILCQNPDKHADNFTKYEIVLENVKCNGVKVEKDVAPAIGGVYYVYDKARGGIITGQDNDPVIIYK